MGHQQYRHRLFGTLYQFQLFRDLGSPALNTPGCCYVQACLLLFQCDANCLKGDVCFMLSISAGVYAVGLKLSCWVQDSCNTPFLESRTSSASDALVASAVTLSPSITTKSLSRTSSLSSNELPVTGLHKCITYNVCFVSSRGRLTCTIHVYLRCCFFVIAADKISVSPVRASIYC